MIDNLIKFGPCCFCGKDIIESDIDPCRVTVETHVDKWQVWHCHATCFSERLIVDPMMEPAHF